MAIMEGLATYEIWKTGFGLFVLVLCLCCAIGITVYNYNKNYISTTICNVKSSSDGSFTQTVTYTVNNKEYVKYIPASSTKQNKVTRLSYAYPEGNCTLYYASNDPNTYSVNSNPTVISGIISAVLCVIAVVGFIWFLFLRSHRDVAGVVGGIDAARTVLNFGRSGHDYY